MPNEAQATKLGFHNKNWDTRTVTYMLQIVGVDANDNDSFNGGVS